MQDETHSELTMKVSRETIVDLLPLYSAGEASPQTCALIEEYLQQDPELMRQFDGDGVKRLAAFSTSETAPPSNLELRSFQRTRHLLRWQRRVYGLAIALSIASLGGVGYIQGGHPVFHFFFHYYPQFFVPCASLAVSCWINYFVLGWRLRSTNF